MAIHDPFLPLSTDLQGWAHELRAVRLDAAHLLGPDGEPSDERPMRLGELLERVAGRVPLQVDVKAYADPLLAGRTAEAVCDIAERYDAREWVEVISFFAGACVAAANRSFRARIVTWSDYLPAALAAWAVEQGLAGISCEGFVLGPEFAAAVDGAGLGMSVGAVNSIEQAEKVLPFAPEILVSDRPAELDREISALNAGGRP